MNCSHRRMTSRNILVAASRFAIKESKTVGIVSCESHIIVR
jgi:hypothetical protein